MVFEKKEIKAGRMIVNFKCKNYKSYKDEFVFSFEALDNEYNPNNVSTVELEDGTSLRLLKSAGIFGANASGKSNVIWALYSFVYLVVNSRNFDVRTPVPVYLPFAFNGENSGLTEMELDFIAEKRRYRYAIKFDNQFHLDRLCEVVSGAEIPVYEIKMNQDKSGLEFVVGDAWRGEDLDLSKYVGSTQLFLSVAGINKRSGLDEVYGAIADIMAVPIGDTINLKAINNAVSDNILKNENTEIFSRLKKLVKIADVGVSDIYLREHTADEFNFPDSVPEPARNAFIQSQKWEIKMVHRAYGKDYLLPMDFESTGTKYLFGMGARVLEILNRGGLLACDEMNVATHPELFKLLVSLFHNPTSNPKNAQLIFTTHDASVASGNMFRADQVWFAEKNANGESELFSAQDFEDISINIPFEQWYRSGRFGALPKFGGIDYIFSDGKEDKE